MNGTDTNNIVAPPPPPVISTSRCIRWSAYKQTDSCVISPRLLLCIIRAADLIRHTLQRQRRHLWSERNWQRERNAKLLTQEDSTINSVVCSVYFRTTGCIREDIFYLKLHDQTTSNDVSDMCSDVTHTLAVLYASLKTRAVKVGFKNLAFYVFKILKISKVRTLVFKVFTYCVTNLIKIFGLQKDAGCSQNEMKNSRHCNIEL